jgi:hypothetical protein
MGEKPITGSSVTVMKALLMVMLVSVSALPSGILARTVTVEVTGVGYVAFEDIASARDRAIEDARIRAVEEVSGVQIDSRAIIHRDLLIDSTLVSRSKGIVREYEVVKEERDSHGLYHVTIRAVVEKDRIDDWVSGQKRFQKVLFLTHSARVGEEAFFQKIAGMFDGKGFQIFQNTVDQISLKGLFSGTARKILESMQTDMLISVDFQEIDAECSTQNFCAARVKGAMYLFAPNAGDDMAAMEIRHTADNIRGFANTREMALEKAFAALGDTLAEKLMTDLEQPVVKKVQVVVHHIPDYAAFKEFKKILATLRWVRSVSEDTVGYHPSKSVFLVDYAADPGFLSGMLGKMGKYRFHGRETNHYTLEYKQEDE